MQSRSGIELTEAQVSPPTVRKGRLAQMGGAEQTNSPSCRSLQLPTCRWSNLVSNMLLSIPSMKPGQRALITYMKQASQSGAMLD